MDSKKNIIKLSNYHFEDRNSDFQALSKEKIKSLIKDLGDCWNLKDNDTYIERQIDLPTYIEGVNLTIWLAKLAEEINHHPDILLGYKKVIIRLTTHNIQALSLADFVLAAKIEHHLESK